MTGGQIFMTVWIGGILLSFFIQGRWGAAIKRADLVPPIAVACLWPFGMAILAAASPFMAAYFIGRWSNHLIKARTRA